MDMILDIFQKLGADSSFFYQFIIFGVLFFILDYILMGKLQFVIEQREAKTTRLSSAADDKLNKADEIAIKYKEKIDDVYKTVNEKVSNEKNVLIKENDKVLRSKQSEIIEEFESQRKVKLVEIESQKAEIFKESEQLSDELVKKIEQI